jgi:hypothetical protein
MMMMMILKLEHSVHLLIFLYISVPHPSQSQSTRYSHQSTHLPLPLLFLPVTPWLLAVLFLQMFSPTVGKSKCSYAVSEMLYMTWKTSRHLASRTQICRSPGQSPLKPVKLGLSFENPRAIEYLMVWHSLGFTVDQTNTVYRVTLHNSAVTMDLYATCYNP